MKKLLFIVSCLIIFLAFTYMYLLWNDKEYGNQKVLLIGIDGAEWNIINSMIGEGKLPNFERIAKNGSSGKILSIALKENFKYGTQYISPLIWTSIVTGRSPKEHGIIDFAINNSIASSIHRKVPAIWNILTYYNKKSVIIGWYASFPAESINGFMISSRLGLWGYKAAYNIPIEKYDWLDANLREKIVFPLDFMHELNQAILKNNFDVKFFINKKIVNLNCIFNGIEPAVFFPRIWEEEIYYRILKYLLKKTDFDFAAVYFGGVDVTQHSLWKYQIKDFKEAINIFNHKCKDQMPIENHYILMDKRIGEIYQKYKDKYTIIIISDHGGKSFFYNVKQYYNHSEYGIFFISGKGIKKNYSLKYPAYSHYDILPTILYILDVPISQELKGRIIKDVFTIDYIIKKKTKRVDKYNIKMDKKEKFKEMDIEEIREKLKGLGYIQ